MTAIPARSFAAATAIGAGVTVVSVLPMFLAGAMVGALRQDIELGTAGLGLAIAAFWTTNAATSIHLGRLTDRVGAVMSVRLAATTAAVAALGIGVLATRWWHLVAGLAVAGCAHAVGQPAANRMLVHGARPERLGLAFGLKSAAPPAAAMLAGLSVPAIALTVGWRWAYAISAVMCGLVLATAGRRPPRQQRRTTTSTTPLPDRKVVAMLSAAFGLAVAASTTVPSFYVDAATSAGTSDRLAGLLLAVASLVALATRVVSGWASDVVVRRPLRLCAGLLTSGAVGMVLLAVPTPATSAIGVVVALMGSWGFNAIFWFALVSGNRDAPGTLTGAVVPGGAIGGIAGPAAFGVIAEHVTYPAAWSFAAALTLSAAAAIAVLARRLEGSGAGATTRSGGASAAHKEAGT